MLGVTADDGRHVVFAAQVLLSVRVTQPAVTLCVGPEGAETVSVPQELCR